MRALPMYLGLDLRGGVHFLMQVDMKSALTKKAEATAGDVRTPAARQEHPPRRHHARRQRGEVRFRDAATLTQRAQPAGRPACPTGWTESADGSDFKLRGALKPEAAFKVQEQALKQNITTLHNRVNELGVAEPVIQQQGADRVVVQLPGVQDTAKAKDIIGRTATLELRMVNERRGARRPSAAAARCPSAASAT
jgi:preprotein translocase subunit SecD